MDHNEHLGLNREQLFYELNKVCDALSSQAESIYKNATDAGIERYLDIQLTEDLKERAQKVLGLIDITKYLDQRNDVNQIGLQAVSDIFAKARIASSLQRYGMSIVEMPGWGSSSPDGMGVALNSTDTCITLALHNSNEPGHSLQIVGLELNNRISTKWAGVFQCVGRNIHEPNRSFTMSGGALYKATPTMQISAVVGGSYFGGAVDNLRADEATPTSPMGSLRSELQLLWNIQAHQFNGGISVEYLPSQRIDIKMDDFGITFDQITLSEKWSGKIHLEYVCALSNEVTLSGKLHFNLGHTHSLSGNIGVAFNR